jgi:WD40 repeat protein
MAATGPKRIDLVCADLNGDLWFWDCAALQSETRKVNARTRCHDVYCVSLSWDGRTVALGLESDVIHLLDLEGRVPDRTIRIGCGSKHIFGLAYLPDGHTLVVKDGGSVIHLFDTRSTPDARSLISLAGHTKRIYGIALSPDGKTLATGSGDKSVRLWDLDSRQCIATLRGHSQRVFSVAFSPDGTMLASGALDRTVRVWGVASQSCVSVLSEHKRAVRCVAFAPDGTLASAGWDQTIRLWDVAVPSCTAVLAAEADILMGIVFSADGKLLASRGAGTTVQLWDMASRTCVGVLSHSADVVCFAFRPARRAWSRELHPLFSAEFRAAVWQLLCGQYHSASALHVLPVDVLEHVFAHLAVVW